MQTCITFVEQLRDVDEFMATDTERKLIKAATHDFRSMWFRLSRGKSIILYRIAEYFQQSRS